jgi:hypothetical protein
MNTKKFYVVRGGAGGWSARVIESIMSNGRPELGAFACAGHVPRTISGKEAEQIIARQIARQWTQPGNEKPVGGAPQGGQSFTLEVQVEGEPPEPLWFIKVVPVWDGGTRPVPNAVGFRLFQSRDQGQWPKDEAIRQVGEWTKTHSRTERWFILDGDSVQEIKR